MFCRGVDIGSHGCGIKISVDCLTHWVGRMQLGSMHQVNSCNPLQVMINIPVVNPR
jgi:hypothetical protein